MFSRAVYRAVPWLTERLDEATHRTSPRFVIVFLFYISAQEIKFDLELNPVKLLGNVEVVRSLKDKKKGPKFYVHAKRNPLEAEVNNYVVFIMLLLYLPVEMQWPHFDYCTRLRGIELSGFEPWRLHLEGLETFSNAKSQSKISNPTYKET